MEFKEYSKAVMAWVDGVMQNRGADAEKTLKYCADIEQYAKQTGDPKLLGFAYYYAGETYYVLNEGEQLLKTITSQPSLIWIRQSSGTWLPGLIISLRLPF